MHHLYLLFLLTTQTLSSTPLLKTDEGFTVPPTEYCLSQKSSTCSICIDSLLKGKSCEKLKKKIPHCLQYSSETECEQCQYNFKKSENSSKCEKISKKNCLEENSENECDLCAPGILVQNGLCEEANRCHLQNCYVCNSDFLGEENCEVCEKGFVLDNVLDDQGKQRFFCKEDLWGNCGFVSGGECLICDFGFFMDAEGKCLESRAYDIQLFGGSRVFAVFSVLVFAIFN